MKERQINPFFDSTRYKAVWQSREAVEDIGNALTVGDLILAQIKPVKRNGMIFVALGGLVSDATDSTIDIWNPQYQSFVDLELLEQDDLTFPKDVIDLIDIIPAETNIRYFSNGRFNYDQHISVRTETGIQVLKLKGIFDDYVLGQNIENSAIVITSQEDID